MRNHLNKDLVRYTLIFFGFFFFANTSLAFAGSAALSWDPNTEADLAGYRLYHGSSSGNYGAPVELGNQTTYTVSGLGPGTHYFAVTAYDTSGNESGFSIEVSKATLVSSAAPSAGTPASGTPTGETLFGESSSGQFSAGGAGGGGGCGVIQSGKDKPRSPGDSAEMISMIAFILLILLKKSQNFSSQALTVA